MNYPNIPLDHMDVKVAVGEIVLNILYGRFGYIYESMVEHSHSNRSYELHFIPYGQGTLIANNHKYDITPGTLYMTGPNVNHEQITNPADPMAEYCICFEVLPNSQRSTFMNHREQLDLSLIVHHLVNTPFWFGQDHQNMLQSFEKLALVAKHQYVGYYTNIRNILCEMIIKLVRNYTNNDPSKVGMPLKTLDDKRLVIIENSFLDQYHSITIQELADKLGLSIRQTERMIKHHYGVSFTTKKKQARMNAAAHLLTTTTKTISEIAQQVGFSSLEYFCSTFKKHYNVSASVYRKKHKMDSNQ
jgi:AraC-like DNA-binding protein/mannose-6-phosphate isomerase-like protein (cupin superfamily)